MGWLNKERWRQPSAAMQFTALRACMDATFENWIDEIITTEVFQSRHRAHFDELRKLEPFIYGKDWASR